MKKVKRRKVFKKISTVKKYKIKLFFLNKIKTNQFPFNISKTKLIIKYISASYIHKII